MDGVVLFILCVVCAGLAVLLLRLAYRVCRLEKCLLSAAERLGEPQYE